MRSPDRRVLEAQVLAALAQLATLVDSYAPVGGLAQEAQLALAGEAGLTSRQVHLLRTWAARWAALDHRLRQLYSAHTSHPAVRHALWTLLVAQVPSRPSPATYGSLAALWTEMHGYAPSLEMVPWQHLRRVAGDSFPPSCTSH